jgi:hypothetical protein
MIRSSTYLSAQVPACVDNDAPGGPCLRPALIAPVDPEHLQVEAYTVLVEKLLGDNVHPTPKKPSTPLVA